MTKRTTDCKRGNALEKIEKKLESDNVHAYVRIRPPLPNETKGPYTIAVRPVLPNSLEITDNQQRLRNFNYTGIFPGSSGQLEVYKAVAAPRLMEMLNGYNCTIFAYGQTGTGKTFSMEGRDTRDSRWDVNSDAGLIPRALQHLFEELENLDSEFSVSISYVELYNERLHDLFSPHYKELKLRNIGQDNVTMEGVEEVMVHNIQDVYGALDKAHSRRTASTMINENSSRSHCVFTINTHILRSNENGEETLTDGKLHLVDLAGSENIGRSGATDGRAREAGSINKSLLTLERVITSLINKQSHIPYRESMLTRLLQDALGGKAKTSIIATISPTDSNIEETINTCKYAHRAQNIINRPEKNSGVAKKTLIHDFTIQIERLKRDLRSSRSKNGIYLEPERYEEMVQKLSQNTQDKVTYESNQENLKEILDKTQQEVSDLRVERDQAKHSLKKLEKELQLTNKELKETKKQHEYSKMELVEKNYIIKTHEEVESSLRIESSDLRSVILDMESTEEKLRNKIEDQSQYEIQLIRTVRETEKKLFLNCQDFKLSVEKLSKRNRKFLKLLAQEVGVKFVQEVAPFLKELQGMFHDIHTNFNNLCTLLYDDTVAHIEDQTTIRNSTNETIMKQKLEVLLKDGTVPNSFAVLLEEFQCLMGKMIETKSMLNANLDNCGSLVDDLEVFNTKSFQSLHQNLESTLSQFREMTTQLNDHFKYQMLHQKESRQKAQAALKTELQNMIESYFQTEEEHHESINSTFNDQISNIESFAQKNVTEVSALINSKKVELACEISRVGAKVLDTKETDKLGADHVHDSMLALKEQIISTKDVLENKENNVFELTTKFLDSESSMKLTLAEKDENLLNQTNKRTELELNRTEESRTQSAAVVQSFDQGINSTVDGVKEILGNFSGKLDDGYNIFQEQFQKISTTIENSQNRIKPLLSSGETPVKRPTRIVYPTPAIWDSQDRKNTLSSLQEYKNVDENQNQTDIKHASEGSDVGVDANVTAEITPVEHQKVALETKRKVTKRTAISESAEITNDENESCENIPIKASKLSKKLEDTLNQPSRSRIRKPLTANSQSSSKVKKSVLSQRAVDTLR